MLRKSVVPCFIPFGSVSRFGTPSGRSCTVAGMFHATQCTQVPRGASGSSAMSAKLLALAGTADQLKGGDRSEPSHVYVGGIISPASNAELFRSITLPRLPDLHCFIHFRQSLGSNGMSLRGAGVDDLIHNIWLLHELAALLPDRREPPDDAVRQQSLAINAANLGGPAFLVDPIDHCLRGDGGFVEREDRTDVRVAFVRTADAGRIGHHRLELGPDGRLGV